MGRLVGRLVEGVSMRTARWAVPALLPLLVLAACTSDDEPRARPPIAVPWAEHELPVPPGPGGRTVVRDAVHCGEAWYAVGAVFLDQPTETRDTRPSAWRSGDGATWSPVEVVADTYWGKRAILNSIACSRGRIAVVGARSGGAHGNPRVTTFHLQGDTLVDVRAVFTQYGGVSASSVGAVSGGPQGWMIAGNRLSGPGVWVTDDPRGFTRVEGEPGLTRDGELVSQAQAAAWAGDGWLLVGAGAVPGELMDRDPLAWTSKDGLTWSRDEMPATRESEDVLRAVLTAEGDVVALGLRGDTFAAWTRDSEGWHESVRFGRLADERTAAPYVASLVRTTSGLLATISTGTEYQLWHSDDGSAWHPVELPDAPATAGDHALSAAEGDGILVVADDGSGARVWTAGEL